MVKRRCAPQRRFFPYLAIESENFQTGSARFSLASYLSRSNMGLTTSVKDRQGWLSFSASQLTTRGNTVASNRSVLFKLCFVFCAISHIFCGQPGNAFNTSIAFRKALIASFMRLIEIRLLKGICSLFPSALRGELGQTRDCSASMFCGMRKLCCRGLRSCDGLRIRF